MGVVYRAVDTQLGRPVALKFVSASESADPGSRARLLREAQAAAALNHPNICTIYSVGEAGHQLFIAMEYLEGSDLRTMIYRGALPWNRPFPSVNRPPAHWKKLTLMASFIAISKVRIYF